MKRAALGSMIVVLVTSPAAIAQAQRLTEPPVRARAVVGVEMGGTSVLEVGQADADDLPGGGFDLVAGGVAGRVGAPAVDG